VSLTLFTLLAPLLERNAHAMQGICFMAQLQAQLQAHWQAHWQAQLTFYNPQSYYKSHTIHARMQ